MLSDWSPEIALSKLAWIMPPSVIALTRLPPEEPSPGGFRLLPDVDPAVPGKQMAFAQWRRTDGKLELAWTNGFAGMVMTLSSSGDAFRGSGHTLSDVIGEVPVQFKVHATRVDCVGLKHERGAAQQ